MSAATIVILIIAILAIAVAVWMFLKTRRTERLRNQFGPEYDHMLRETGQRSAESLLENRARRVAKFHIRPLTTDERSRFSNAWKREQARFVDDPRSAVNNADRLLSEVMQTRGYPMGEFEQQAADISVEHPQVVENYRAGHNIALLDSRGQAVTEDLRQAMVHYRALFLDLVEQPAFEPQEVRR